MTIKAVNDFTGVYVGHATDAVALTGCSTVIFPDGAVCGHVAFGSATGSRELETVTPRHSVERIHAICLSGGSAFGLAAAGGVMSRLEREGIGHTTSICKIPIVPAAVVYDLNLGRSEVRPDKEMGASAADDALNNPPASSGNIGAGCGVSAGKILGIHCATKTGLGNGGIETEDGLAFGALAVVNPVGDVVDLATQQILAGARKAPASNELVGSYALLCKSQFSQPKSIPSDHHNTTLGVIVTNVKLTRLETSWVAEQCLVTLARMIDPPFTRHDGDIIFCASVGEKQADLHRVACYAREAFSAAILDGVLSSTPAGGIPNWRGLRQPKID